MIAELTTSFFSILALGPGELSEATLIILTLILLEGLLSVDNALAIAAMANHLPPKQQKLALKLGIIGAYAFRGLVIVFAAWLMNNEWVKWLGAAYLVYLAAKHLSGAHHEEGHEHVKKKKGGLVSAVIGIELMDLSLSIDNVIVALATVNKSVHIPKEHHIWVVCIGVFIGILALRLVAGWCLGIIKKFPVLTQTAFLLVGYVGLLFMGEMTAEHYHIDLPNTMIIKFGGIFGILILSLYYDRNEGMKELLRPAVRFCSRFNYALAWLVELPFRPFAALFHKIFHKHV